MQLWVALFLVLAAAQEEDASWQPLASLGLRHSRPSLRQFANGFQAGRSASSVRPLLTDAQYEALLRRQNELGEMLDMSRIPRPSLGAVDGSEVFVSQGAGRWEKTPSALASGRSPMFDIFVPEGSALPAGSRVLQRNVPGRTVSIANQISSRGAAGSNPLLVDFLTEGKTFQRVQVPTSSLRAGTSEVANALRRFSPDAVNDPALRFLTPRQKLGVLNGDEMIQRAPGAFEALGSRFGEAFGSATSTLENSFTGARHALVNGVAAGRGNMISGARQAFANSRFGTSLANAAHSRPAMAIADFARNRAAGTASALGTSALHSRSSSAMANLARSGAARTGTAMGAGVRGLGSVAGKLAVPLAVAQIGYTATEALKDSHRFGDDLDRGVFNGRALRDASLGFTTDLLIGEGNTVVVANAISSAVGGGGQSCARDGLGRCASSGLRAVQEGLSQFGHAAGDVLSKCASSVGQCSRNVASGISNFAQTAAQRGVDWFRSTNQYFEQRLRNQMEQFNQCRRMGVKACRARNDRLAENAVGGALNAVGDAAQARVNRAVRSATSTASSAKKWAQDQLSRNPAVQVARTQTKRAVNAVTSTANSARRTLTNWGSSAQSTANAALNWFRQRTN